MKLEQEYQEEFSKIKNLINILDKPNITGIDIRKQNNEIDKK